MANFTCASVFNINPYTPTTSRIGSYGGSTSSFETVISEKKKQEVQSYDVDYLILVMICVIVHEKYDIDMLTQPCYFNLRGSLF